MKVECDIISYKNTYGVDKPNEDLAVFNAEKHFGMVLDGVSRDRENGIYPSPSPAAEACQLFASSINDSWAHDNFCELQFFPEAIRKANSALHYYNDLLQHRFPAGTVGIVFSILDYRLCYAYIGDCCGAFLREGRLRVFTESQTDMVKSHKKEFTSDQIRFDICNHISHPCGYGVWDGNAAAMDFVKYGEIQLLPQDAILFCTDGLEAELLQTNEKQLKDLSLTTLFSQKAVDGLDDRTCLRIRIS